MYVLTYNGRPIDCGSLRGNYASAPKEWTFPSDVTSFIGNRVWTDGSNIYYSQGSTQLVLNKSTGVWTKKTWSGTTFVPENFYFYLDRWYRGNYQYIYYSGGSGTYTQYYLNKSNSSWNSTAFNISGIQGRYIWKQGSNVYYSVTTTHKKWNDLSAEWQDVTWNGLSSFSGDNIWTDGTNTYYYDQTNRIHYVLNVSTSTWSQKTFYGFKASEYFFVKYVWHRGSDTFFSDGDIQYKLNKSTSTWEHVDFGLSFTAENVWTDGTNYYVGRGYQLLFNAAPPQYNFISHIGSSSAYQWVQVFDGNVIGSDVFGEGNTYFSDFASSASPPAYHLRLNSSTDEWEIYDGFTSTATGNKVLLNLGRRVWKFQGSLIYSDDTMQYILNPSTMKATPRTWSGYTPYDGQFIWSDGNTSRMYYSYTTSHYMLTLLSGEYQWLPKTWNGLTNFSGHRVWMDLNGNVYYSSGTTQYQLNVSTSTWTQKTWYGLQSFDGEYVWTDNQKMFVSDSNGMYVLDMASSTWNPIEFDGSTVRPTGRQVYWYKGNLYFGKYKLVNVL